MKKILYLLIFVLSFQMKNYAQNQITPEFIGNKKTKTFIEYINKNLRYPKKVCIEGSVFVKCTIDVKGKIKNISVKKGIDVRCDEEAKRLIEEMNYTENSLWKPAIKNGISVESNFIIPIKFKL